MTPASAFNERALERVRAEAERLRGALSFAEACILPEVAPQDVVVAGKEVQLTIFRQSNLACLEGRVLITLQIARHGLGGIVLFSTERGLVFSPDTAPRDATEAELRDSAG